MPLLPEVGRVRWKSRLVFYAIAVLLWVGVLIHFFPFYWTVIGSFKDDMEIFQFPPTLWPHHPTLFVWKAVVTNQERMLAYLMGGSQTWTFLKNSIILTMGTMAFQIPICALAAYALSKLVGPKWNRIIFLFLIGSLFIPGQVSLIPQYLILRFFPFFSRNIPLIPFTNSPFPTINFLGTYWAVILPGIVSAFSIIVFKGYFDMIPNELLSAARIDGASEFGIFRRIVLPLSKPVFAVVAWFTFGATWNAFMWPLIALRGKLSLLPLPVAIYRLRYTIEGGATGQMMGKIGVSADRFALGGYTTLFVVLVIEAIPLIIVFFLLKEPILKGIKLRGFK